MTEHPFLLYVMIDLNSVELLVIHLNFWWGGGGGGRSTCTDHTHFYKKKYRHNKQQNHRISFPCVIIVLNSVEFLVLHISGGDPKSHQLAWHPGSVSVGVPRPVRVGVTGLVSIRHSLTSLE